MSHPSDAFWWQRVKQDVIDTDKAIMKKALTWSTRANCLKKSVGCVLVDKKNNILSTGYNFNVVDNVCDCSDNIKDTNTCKAVHAEANALINCTDTSHIDSCYITNSPCYHCIKMLLSTSCKRIVFIYEYDDPNPKRLWTEAGRQWIKLTGEI